MVEVIKRIPDQQVSATTLKGLGSSSRVARRHYFIEAGQRPDEHLASLDAITPRIAQEITSRLNVGIQNGGKVVIIDFPNRNQEGPGSDYTRTQVFNQNMYLRREAYTPDITVNVERKVGTFSMRVGKPRRAEHETAIGAEVRDVHGHRKLFGVYWDARENPARRFAILTQEKGKWSTVLSFDYEGDKPPAWKVPAELVPAPAL